MRFSGRAPSEWSDSISVVERVRGDEMQSERWGWAESGQYSVLCTCVGDAGVVLW